VVVTELTGLAIQEVSAGADRATVNRFLKGRSLPIVEPGRITFVYRGKADAVRLRHWIYGLRTADDLTRVPGTDLWYLVIEIPDGSRVEYKFEVTRGRRIEWLEDPVNPNRAYDPFGANSVAHAWGYHTPEWTRTDPDVPEGTLEERVFRSAALGGDRRISLYRPARFKETRQHPLLIVHDGGDYVEYAALKTVLDNLINRLEIPGVVAALMHPPDRVEQYRDNEAHARYLTEELVPRLEEELPLFGTPEARCLMGASLGGVAALSTAARYPGFYGRLLLQSGSFAFSDIGGHGRGPVFDPIADFMNDFRRRPAAVSEKVFISCGVYESLIYENRSLVPLLQETGMNVRFVEARDGHNWENWRDRLRTGLSWLFPGPLWLVYE